MLEDPSCDHLQTQLEAGIPFLCKACAFDINFVLRSSRHGHKLLCTAMRRAVKQSLSLQSPEFCRTWTWSLAFREIGVRPNYATAYVKSLFRLSGCVPLDGFSNRVQRLRSAGVLVFEFSVYLGMNMAGSLIPHRISDRLLSHSSQYFPWISRVAPRGVP